MQSDFFFFLLQKITLAISWGKGGSWELTRRLFRQPRKARNDGDNIEAPTTNAFRNLPKKKERNLPVGLFGVGIFPRALSQSHTFSISEIRTLNKSILQPYLLQLDVKLIFPSH